MLILNFFWCDIPLYFSNIGVHLWSIRFYHKHHIVTIPYNHIYLLKRKLLAHNQYKVSEFQLQIIIQLIFSLKHMGTLSLPTDFVCVGLIIEPISTVIVYWKLYIYLWKKSVGVKQTFFCFSTIRLIVFRLETLKKWSLMKYIESIDTIHMN